MPEMMLTVLLCSAVGLLWCDHSCEKEQEATKNLIVDCTITYLARLTRYELSFVSPHPLRQIQFDMIYLTCRFESVQSSFDLLLLGLYF
jgi:hypothetical protein